ncbi:MAG TPA: hypothetical protein GX713_00445 [Mollicutes bacterium]|nr:hypothetical protein [Mollicutes bacterium]
MKKYLILIISITSLILLLKQNESYGFNNCYLKKEVLNGVNHNNLKDYLNNSSVKYESICSFNDCYKLKTNNIEQEIENFIKFLEINKDEDYLIEGMIKGYPVTEITFNQCL